MIFRNPCPICELRSQISYPKNLQRSHQAFHRWHRFLSFDAKVVSSRGPPVFMIPRRTREAEKNVRDEIGEGQNAWQITRLVHQWNETKHRPRTRTPLCSHCTRVSLRGSEVRHSAERRCRIAIRWRPIKVRQIGTTRTTAAARGRYAQR